MEDGSLLHRSLVVFVTAHVRLPHMYTKHTNACVKEFRLVFSVTCQTPHCTMHYRIFQRWKLKNLAVSSTGQLITFQSRAPHIPLLLPHFWPHKPILLWKLVGGHKGGGKESKSSLSQACYHSGPAVNLSGKYFAKIKCICDEEKHYIKLTPS